MQSQGCPAVPQGPGQLVGQTPDSSPPAPQPPRPAWWRPAPQGALPCGRCGSGAAGPAVPLQLADLPSRVARRCPVAPALPASPRRAAGAGQGCPPPGSAANSPGTAFLQAAMPAFAAYFAASGAPDPSTTEGGLAAGAWLAAYAAAFAEVSRRLGAGAASRQGDGRRGSLSAELQVAVEGRAEHSACLAEADRHGMLPLSRSQVYAAAHQSAYETAMARGGIPAVAGAAAASAAMDAAAAAAARSAAAAAEEVQRQLEPGAAAIAAEPELVRPCTGSGSTEG